MVTMCLIFILADLPWQQEWGWKRGTMADSLIQTVQLDPSLFDIKKLVGNVWEDVRSERRANHSRGNGKFFTGTQEFTPISSLLVFSNGWPTGRSPRSGRRHQPSRCLPAVARLEPGAGGPAAGSAKRASGTSAESVTSAGTWRSSEGLGEWSSPASWDNALR